MALFGGSNWVDRRKQATEILNSKAESLWHDVRAAIEDASRSFNGHYGRDLSEKSTVVPTNDHRLRVSVTGSVKDRIVDIDFNRENKTITGTAHDGGAVKVFQMVADSTSAFLTEGDNTERIEPDKLSEKVLVSLFFPEESVYNKRGIITG